MSSLADEIARLTNPAPTIQDPEEDINTETTAKVSEKFDEGGGFNEQISLLRNRNAPLLEDLDARYAGKRVSRATLEKFMHNESESDSSSSEEDESEDDGLYEEIKSFKQHFSEKEVPELEQSETEELVQSGEHSESGSKSSDDDEDDESPDDGSAADIIQQFSHIDVHSEVEKGKAVEAQQDLWNKLCECRIKLQKLLVVANKLPQFDTWKNFKEKGDKSYSDDLNKGYNSVKNILGNFLELQTFLLASNSETSFLENNNNDVSTDIKVDEEIPTDTDDEDNNMDCNAQAVTAEPKSRKRKLKNDDYAEYLEKRHKSFIPYRNSVIQKWDDKTRLSTGKLTQKSFNAFDQSALKQIDQILQDKVRLIKRTQLKRTAFRVLGKVEEKEIKNTVDNLNEMTEEDQAAARRDDHLKDYDPEIFDDNDFYRQLLKDIIETKSMGMDPLILSKQLEIQRVRSKMRRKVDTKASKGRKIRYHVHPKLVNFMAPFDTFTMTDEAKDDLFKSVFGPNTALMQT